MECSRHGGCRGGRVRTRLHHDRNVLTGVGGKKLLHHGPQAGMSQVGETASAARCTTTTEERRSTLVLGEYKRTLQKLFLVKSSCIFTCKGWAKILFRAFPRLVNCVPAIA